MEDAARNPARGRRDWFQFEIRLAEPAEIDAEQAYRKAQQEETEREQTEWRARWDARGEIRGSCELFAVAQKKKRKSECSKGELGTDAIILSLTQ